MLTLIILTAILLYPSDSYAFNPIVLLDPDFIIFIAVKLPLIGGTLIAIWEYCCLRRILNHDYNIKSAIRLSLINNILAFFLYVVISLFILLITAGLFESSELPLGAFAAIYFGAMFIYFSYQKKVKLLKKFTTEPLKAFKIKIFLINIIAYSMIYIHLFYRLF